MYFTTIEYDNFHLADDICCISEEMIDCLDETTILYLLEELGDKFRRRIANTMINHRNRDADIYMSDSVRQSIPIYKAEEEIEYRKAIYDINKDKELKKKINKLKRLISDFRKLSEKYKDIHHPKIYKKACEIRDLSNKMKKYERDMIKSKGISDKEYKELQKKYHIISINDYGGIIDTGLIKIDGMSKDGRPNTYETMHAKRNKRIGDAISRLEEYLNKKGYTDDQYAKEHDKLVGSRVNPTRRKIMRSSPDSAIRPIVNIKQDPNDPLGILVDEEQYRDDGTLR